MNADSLTGFYLGFSYLPEEETTQTSSSSLTMLVLRLLSLNIEKCDSPYYWRGQKVFGRPQKKG